MTHGLTAEETSGAPQGPPGPPDGRQGDGRPDADGDISAGHLRRHGLAASAQPAKQHWHE